ncbi:MAG: hypothetical protein WA871_15705, partial [Candidatus Acidiferrales bacterium]
LNTACVTFSTTYGGFPAAFSYLGGEGTSSLPTSTSAELIDNVLQTEIKSGYSFSWSAATPDAAGNIDNYAISASPITAGVTGIRYFFTDQTGVIRASAAGTATSASTPLS